MRYKNEKTGAIIDSPFNLYGDDIVEIEDKHKETRELSKSQQTGIIAKNEETIDQLNKKIQELEQQLEEKETDDTTDPADEDSEEEYEEVDLEQMTNKQLEKFAEDEGIELTTEDKKNKPARIKKIAATFEE